MNRSKLWGFEVSQIVTGFGVLVATNVVLGAFQLPLILSWIFGMGTAVGLRIVSVGQKNGHLELTVRFMAEPHLFLGHRERGRK